MLASNMLTTFSICLMPLSFTSIHKNLSMRFCSNCLRMWTTRFCIYVKVYHKYFRFNERISCVWLVHTSVYWMCCREFLQVCAAGFGWKLLVPESEWKLLAKRGVTSSIMRRPSKIHPLQDKLNWLVDQILVYS